MAAPAHTKVTREDWIAAARARLVLEPVDQLKVMVLAGDLGVSRSSFYWYFDDASDVQAELLHLWRDNTEAIVDRCERETESPVAACLAVFECWADENLYDSTLDASIRDWGRRDPTVGDLVADADQKRLAALAAMFSRHDLSPDEAAVRARLLYHSQLGYYATGTDESIDARLSYLPYYLEAVAGSSPAASEIATFTEFLRSIGSL